MTELAASEDLVLVDVDAAPVDAVGGLDRLVAAWLLGFESVHTRRAYGGDIAVWLAFCEDHRLDPLADVRRSHVDAWARTLEATGYRPHTVARRIASVSSWYPFWSTKRSACSPPFKTSADPASATGARPQA